MTLARELADTAGRPQVDKNLLINGQMAIFQRSTSASVSTDIYSTVDRFMTRVRGGAVYTISRSTDVPSAQGFGYSLKFDNTTADASPTSNDFTLLEQRIEGQNLQHLLKGTSSAKAITLSFHIKSNLTGTFIARLYDDDNVRSISKSYTISSANTWEKKELTFEGDTTGTLDNDNAVSLRVQWWFSAGTDYTSGTLQTTWGSAIAADLAPGISNLASSTSNELYITGVQLEIGEAATDFQFEPYAATLTKCTRYLHKITNVGGTNFASVGSGVENNSTQAFVIVPHITPMRAQPSMSYSALSHFDLEARDKVPTSIATSLPDTGGMTSTLVVTVASGLTLGSGALLIMDQANAYIQFDAEL
jgi:hypothetical protein